MGGLHLPSPWRVPQTPRRTLPQAQIHAVLDAGVVCHVAIVAHESPVIIPTNYVRYGDYVYLHGKVCRAVRPSLAIESRSVPPVADPVNSCEPTPTVEQHADEGFGVGTVHVCHSDPCT